MPRERQSLTHKFSIAGHEGYITAGMYEDGTVGEIFLTDIGKEGSTLRGMMNAFATSISIALQYGVPLETLVRKFSYMRFDPEGMTDEPGDPVRQVDARLHHALAGVALPRRRRRTRTWASSPPRCAQRKLEQDALMRGDTAGPVATGGTATAGTAATTAEIRSRRRRR